MELHGHCSSRRRDDHEPAHVHVIGDGEVVINLVGTGGTPVVRQAFGSTKAEIRKSLRIVSERQAYLLAKWKDIHDGID